MAKKLEYQALLEEEKLSLENLPMEIRKRINVLKPLIAKYNDNPTDKMKQAIIKNDVEIAEMIADYIEKDLPEQNEGDDDDDDNKNGKKGRNRQNDDDDDNDDNDDNEEGEEEEENNPKKVVKKPIQKQQPPQKSPEEIAAEKKAADEKAAAEKAEADRLAAEEEQRKKDAAKVKITDFGTLDMEKKITENCEKNNGFITEKDLISIIGKSPDYPKQKVYSITLKKVFMKSLYQLI